MGLSPIRGFESLPLRHGHSCTGRNDQVRQLSAIRCSRRLADNERTRAIFLKRARRASINSASAGMTWPVSGSPDQEHSGEASRERARANLYNTCTHTRIGRSCKRRNDLARQWLASSQSISRKRRAARGLRATSITTCTHFRRFPPGTMLSCYLPVPPRGTGVANRERARASFLFEPC